MKKLYKDKKNGKLCGVLAGFAEAFDIDVTMVRIIFVVLLIIFHGIPFILAYILACWLMPEKDEKSKDDVIDGKVE